MKSRAQVISTFLAITLLPAGLIAEAQGIISTFPSGGGSGGMYIGTDAPGNFEGGAVAFTPEQNYTLTSASVGLSGYDGSYGQLASLSIFSDLSQPYSTSMPDQPGQLLVSGTVAPNDGSEATFTVNFAGGVNLAANSIYWLFVQDTSPNGWEAPNGFNWIVGGDASGAAAYDGSEAFIVSGFSPISDPPAFGIDATPMSVPEPSSYKLMGAAALAGLMVSGWRRAATRRALHQSGRHNEG
jgi:hypothetical protein